jgi:hypothetical protein
MGSIVNSISFHIENVNMTYSLIICIDLMPIGKHQGFPKIQN